MSAVQKHHRYLIDFAPRHLVAGLIRPRTATAEAMATGFGEGTRLTLVIASGLSEGIANRSTREAINSTLEKLELLPDTYVFGVMFIFTLTAIMYSSFLTISYLGMAGTVAGFMRACGTKGQSFVETRSVIALASWFALIPDVIISLASDLMPTWLSLIGLLVGSSYVTAVLNAASGLSVGKAAGAAILAMVVFSVLAAAYDTAVGAVTLALS